MDAFILYILKVNIAITVLYGFYCLCMDKDTFFNIKRVFLLTVLAFSLCYPFMDYSFNWLTEIWKAGNILTGKITIFIMPENIVATQITGEPSVENYKYNWLSAIYISGVILFFLRTIAQLTSIAVNIRKSRPAYLLGRKVYISGQTTNPYSFFGYIIIGDNLTNEKDLQEILKHEETHVKQYHSIDVIFSQLISAFCWFNPFVWLMNKKIRMNLEFMADRSVLKSGHEPEHYQSHILRLSYHKAAATLYNNLNFSPLKKRIQMMNKKKTPGLYFLKYILIAPVVFTLLFVNSSFKAEQNEAVSATDNTRPYTLSDTIKAKSAIPDDDVHTTVEEMPLFMGDVNIMGKAREYVYKNIRYPEDARNNNVQGIVRLSFVVDKTGKVRRVKVTKSSGSESLDKEAVRVVESLPDWTPGKQDGKLVNVQYYLAVQFALK